MRVLVRRLADLLLRRRRDRRLDDEVTLHLELPTEELIARGLEPQRAHAEARRQFGVDRMKMQYRDQRAIIGALALGVGARGDRVHDPERDAAHRTNGGGMVAVAGLSGLVLAVACVACAVPIRCALVIDRSSAPRAE